MSLYALLRVLNRLTCDTSFVWGIVATIQSRSLLHLRKVELKSRTENIVRPRAISPFGIGDTTDSEDEFVKGGPSNIFMLANLRTV